MREISQLSCSSYRYKKAPAVSRYTEIMLGIGTYWDFHLALISMSRFPGDGQCSCFWNPLSSGASLLRRLERSSEHRRECTQRKYDFILEIIDRLVVHLPLNIFPYLTVTFLSQTLPAVKTVQFLKLSLTLRENFLHSHTNRIGSGHSRAL